MVPIAPSTPRPCVRRSVVPSSFPFFSLSFFLKNVRDLGKTFADAAAAAAAVAGDARRPGGRPDPTQVGIPDGAAIAAEQRPPVRFGPPAVRRPSDLRLLRPPPDVGGPCPIARFVTITEYELVYRHPFTRPRSAQGRGARGREGREAALQLGGEGLARLRRRARAREGERGACPARQDQRKTTALCGPSPVSVAPPPLPSLAAPFSKLKCKV